MSEYHNFLLKKNRDQYSPESLCKQLLHFYYLKRGSIWTYARAGRQDTMAAKQQPFAQREVVLSKVCKSKKGFTHFWEYYLIHQQYAWDSYFLLPAKKKKSLRMSDYQRFTWFFVFSDPPGILLAELPRWYLKLYISCFKHIPWIIPLNFYVLLR